MINEDGLGSNNEQSFSIIRGQIERKIDSELDTVGEEPGMFKPSGRWSKDYEIDPSLLTAWRDKPLMGPEDRFKEGPLSLTIASLEKWVATDDDGEQTEYLPLKYVALYKDLEAPDGQRIAWACTFQFWEGAGAVIKAQRVAFNHPIIYKPGRPMDEVIALSRPLSDKSTETSISKEGLEILKKCLENAHPLEKK